MTPARAAAPGADLLPPADVATEGPPPPAGAPSLADDVRAVAPALLGGRGLLLAPLSAATWRAVSQTVVGAAVLLVAGVTVLVAVPVLAASVLVGVGLPLLLLVLLASRPAAALERARLRAHLDVRVTPPSYAPRDAGGGRWWRGWRPVIADPRRWAHLLYAVVGLVLAGLGLAAVAGLGGGLALVALPAYRAWTGAALSGLLVVAGLGAVWLAALLVQAATLAQVRLARALLGRSPSAALVEAARRAEVAAQERASRAEVRAEHLAQTRARAVGAADDERRRIERDLHDGAQQRLVALGVALGLARRAAATDTAAAAAALDHAHQEVKEALAELRDLVRGIHPAVLTDRGLDAALSALAVRCPVPVAVEVPSPEQLADASPAAAAAAYFVAAEALTNVARHSAAARAQVHAEVVGGRLRLTVSDDGRGGARGLPGSGLDGLRSRVEALDGTFALESPHGRGTRLTVEVPCAS